MHQTIKQTRQRFDQGLSRASAISDALARITEPSGQGKTTFLKVYDDASAVAANYDAEARPGKKLPPYAGISVSIKDLFDVAGDVTTAGSTFLKTAQPATRDAVVVARLKKAGFVPVGRTNMTEFAFSGLGINPHYGTPLNPYDRANARIPGGSSSGAAVSVSDGMADVGLGTDTGGSCRIPAALCGLVGFKPTASRVPMEGTLPLSPSLDSIGSIGRSVECCAAVDSVISEEPSPRFDREVGTLKIGVPSAYVFDDMDRQTAKAFDDALARLSKAGAKIIRVDTPELLEIPAINSKGGLTAREAFLFHRHWIETRASEYDPRVIVRLRKGDTQSDEDYEEVKTARRSLIARVAARSHGLDAMVMPTVPLVAPRLDELATDGEYGRINLLMLRNCTVVNMLDRCAISLPCHETGAAPVGLMLMGEHDGDARLFQVAQAVERCLQFDAQAA